MRRRLLRPSVLVAVSALTLAGAGSLPALAATGTAPAVTVATAPGDPGLLVVTATSDSAVTGVVAQIRLLADAGGDLVATAPLTEGTDGLWHSDRLVLDYAEYDVTAVATDEDGDVNPVPAALRLGYFPQGIVQEHSLSSLDLDFDHRDVVARGTLAKMDPRDGLTTPAVGAEVSLQLGQAVSRADTGQDGGYEVHAGLDMRYFTATSFPVTTTWERTAESEVEPPSDGPIDQETAHLTRIPARIVLEATFISVRYPATAELSGVVQRQVDGEWVPLRDVLVDHLTGPESGEETSPDLDGRFSLSVPVTDDGPVTLELNEAWVPYFGRAAATVQVTVMDSTSIEWTQQLINEYSELAVSGRLVTSSGANPPALSRVWVQRSTDRTTWTTLGSMTTGADGRFGDQFPLERPYGYFRLVYKGSADLQPRIGDAVKLSRTMTRVIGVDAAPEPIRSGRTLHVTGTVQRFVTGAWRPMPAGRLVVLVFCPTDGYCAVRNTRRTSATGTFSIPAIARRDGYWYAAYVAENTVDLTSWSGRDYVDVR